MSNIKELFKKLRGKKTIQYPHFQITPNHVLDREFTKGEFKAGEDYFEIRLVRHFLKYQRSYWKEYDPITIVLTEFIHGNSIKAFPFIVGPELLKGKVDLQDDDNISYVNTRVAGPTPYQGDQMVIFTGLFGMKTKDWAKKSLNLIQNVASAFNAAILTNYLNIASPLLTGIEDFLSMKDMELRIGQRNEMKDSSLADGSQFRPGVWVLIKSEKNIEQNTVWLQNDKLYIGNNKDSLEEYKEDDYLIYSIEKLKTRHDYKTLNFHITFRKIEELIINNQKGAAKAERYKLGTEVAACDDLIESQKTKILDIYDGIIRTKLEEDNYIDDLFGSSATNRETGDKQMLNSKRNIEKVSKLIGDTKMSDPDLINDFIIKHINELD